MAHQGNNTDTEYRFLQLLSSVQLKYFTVDDATLNPFQSTALRWEVTALLTPHTPHNLRLTINNEPVGMTGTLKLNQGMV